MQLDFLEEKICSWNKVEKKFLFNYGLLWFVGTMSFKHGSNHNFKTLKAVSVLYCSQINSSHIWDK